MASANNFGFGDGIWFANGRYHYFRYEALTPAYTTAANDARTTDLNPTDINTYDTSNHDLADVAVYDLDEGDNGRYGIYQCLTANGQSCNHAHVT